MDKGCYVKDIVANTEITGLFAVEQATSSLTRNNLPYWNIIFSDVSGQINAKIWSPLSKEINDIPTGSFVEIRAQAQFFQGEQLQLIVKDLRFLTDPEELDSIDLAFFTPASEYSAESMFDELEKLCQEEFTYRPWKKFIFAILNDPEIRAGLLVWPAATKLHHAYTGGLLEHTLSVFKLCRRIAKHYPELDRQTLLAGALCHDLGKLKEFTQGTTFNYTDSGHLLGHLVQGLLLLEPFLQKSTLEADLQLHLRHLIASHHGQKEFGAVQVPLTPEALVLHFADNLDAKMAQCRKLYTQISDNTKWTSWQKNFDAKMFRAMHTPENFNLAGQTKKKNPKTGEEQCLSLLKV